MPSIACSVCNRLQTLPRSDWKYVDQSGPHCCSASCVRTWIEAQVPPKGVMKYDIRLNTDRADFVFSTFTGMNYRSRYELFFAEWLADNEIRHAYEPVEFHWGDGKRYTPDFYINARSCFIEVKGAWGASQKSKLAEFRAAHPELSLLVVPWTVHRDFYRDEV